MKQNGKDLAREDRTGAVDETRERRQLQIGPDEENADREQQHHAELHERAQIVARREQQPHRQRAREEAVDDDGDRQRDRRTA